MKTDGIKYAVSSIAAALLFVIMFAGAGYAQDKHEIDKLQQALATAKDTARVSIMIKLVQEYYFNDMEKASQMGNQALELSTELNYKSGIANSLNALGKIDIGKSEYDSAKSYIMRALKISKSIGNNLDIAHSYALIGSIYRRQGNYPQAINYNLRSLAIYDSLGEEISKSDELNGLGLIYSREKDFKKSLDYYNKSLKIREKRHDDQRSAETLGNIGIVYNEQGRYKKAIKIDKQALLLQKKLNALREEAMGLNNIGLDYLNLKQYKSANTYFQDALKIHKQLGNKFDMATTLLNIGYNLGYLKEFKKAVQDENESLKMLKELGARNAENAVYATLAVIYTREKNYKKAYEYQSKYITLKDSLFNLAKSKQINDLQNHFENEQKELKIKLQKAELERQKQAIYLILGGLVIVVLLEIFLWKTLRDKQKINKALERQKEELNKQKEKTELALVAAEDAKMEAENATRLKTELLGIAVHDLKNPLSAIMGFSDLLKEMSDHKTEFHEFAEYINRGSREMLDLIMQLLDKNALESGKITLNPEIINLSMLVESTLNEYENTAKRKNQDLVLEIEPDCYANADEGRLKEVIENLVSNAIKYSPYNKQITVTLKGKKDTITFAVADEGPGLTHEDKLKIFQRFQRLSAIPTGGETSHGLGLSIAKQLIELMSGTIGVESEEGKGARFYFELPAINVVEVDTLVTGDEQRSVKKEIHFPGKKVLIADDIQSNRETIKRILSQKGIAVIEADNGKQAMERAEKEKPDLIFMDVSMPVVDGIEAVTILKSKSAMQDIPVIAVTAVDMERLKNYPFDGFIKKPVSTSELLAVLENYFMKKMSTL